MKCDACGGEMVSGRENYHYKECGLPFVTLQNLEVRRCPQCGEFEVVIPKIEQLHQAIAWAVVSKKSRLAPAEVKFLRKHLGWSGADFARHIGVSSETVSRWEKGRDPMGPIADRALRLMVLCMAPMRDYSLDTLTELRDQPEPSRIGLRVSEQGWSATGALAA